jgi:hypothetical protein
MSGAQGSVFLCSQITTKRIAARSARSPRAKVPTPNAIPIRNNRSVCHAQIAHATNAKKSAVSIPMVDNNQEEKMSSTAAATPDVHDPIRRSASNVAAAATAMSTAYPALLAATIGPPIRWTPASSIVHRGDVAAFAVCAPGL